MTHSWILLCATAAFLATGLTGCGGAGSDAQSQSQSQTRTIPAPAPLIYEATFRDDSGLPSGVEPKNYQPLTSVLVDVVVTNRSEQTVEAPFLSLRVLNAAGTDITPPVYYLAVMPADILAGNGYRWQGFWNQQDALYQPVVAGTYTVQVVDTRGGGEPKTLVSREITIRPSLTYHLTTSWSAPGQPSIAVIRAPEYDVGATVFLNCLVTNQGDRPFYPGIEGFQVFDEQTGRTILPMTPILCSVPFFPGGTGALGDRFLAPGATGIWTGQWDQFGYQQGREAAIAIGLEPFFPTPGWYRIDLTRRGVVIASTRIRIFSLCPVVVSAHG